MSKCPWLCELQLQSLCLLCMCVKCLFGLLHQGDVKLVPFCRKALLYAVKSVLSLSWSAFDLWSMWWCPLCFKEMKNNRERSVCVCAHMCVHTVCACVCMYAYTCVTGWVASGSVVKDTLIIVPVVLGSNPTRYKFVYIKKTSIAQPQS